MGRIKTFSGPQVGHPSLRPKILFLCQQWDKNCKKINFVFSSNLVDSVPWRTVDKDNRDNGHLFTYDQSQYNQQFNY